MSLLLSDAFGYIRHCETGYHGTNDTGALNRSGASDGTLVIPDWAKVLADGGFPNRPPLIIPFDRNEVRLSEENRRINLWQRFHRSGVERAVNRMKVYRCTYNTWRHPREFQPLVAFVAACLANRKLSEETQARQSFQD